RRPAHRGGDQRHGGAAQGGPGDGPDPRPGRRAGAGLGGAARGPDRSSRRGARRQPRRRRRRLPRPGHPPPPRGSTDVSGWQPVPGTVYIVGGGPGDPDLMTVRARTVLAAAQTVLYADSLVDPQVFGAVAGTAAVRGTSGMTLEPIVAALVAAARRGEVVAGVHSGDPGVYGAIAEQLVRLDEAGVRWE